MLARLAPRRLYETRSWLWLDRGGLEALLITMDAAIGGGGPKNMARGCLSLDDEPAELGLSFQEPGDMSRELVPTAVGLLSRGRGRSWSRDAASSGCGSSWSSWYSLGDRFGERGDRMDDRRAAPVKRSSIVGEAGPMARADGVAGRFVIDARSALHAWERGRALE